MNSRDFCYWLQGYFEISETTNLTSEQIDTIKNHLNLVFLHDIDPQYKGDPNEMKAVHDGVKNKNLMRC